MFGDTEIANCVDETKTSINRSAELENIIRMCTQPQNKAFGYRRVAPQRTSVLSHANPPSKSVNSKSQMLCSNNNSTTLQPEKEEELNEDRTDCSLESIVIDIDTSMFLYLNAIGKIRI